LTAIIWRRDTAFGQRRRGPNKVELRGRKLQFTTDSWKFPTEDIMGAQNFNFAQNSLKMGRFSPKFSISGRKFSDKKIPTHWNL